MALEFSLGDVVAEQSRGPVESEGDEPTSSWVEGSTSTTSYEWFNEINTKKDRQGENTK